MQYRKLGRTDIRISVLSLGCFPLHMCSAEEAAEVLQAAFQGGVNYYDTAPSYGNGDSEEYLGRFLWLHLNDPIYFNDKIGRYAHWNPCPPVPGSPVIHPDDYYQDPEALLKAIKRSLWMLRRDHFDVLSIHEPNWPQWGFDYETGESVILSLVEELKQEGLTRYIGLGGWDHHLNAKLVDTGRIDVVMSAGGMNLLCKPGFKELIPAAYYDLVEVMTCNTGCVGGAGQPYGLVPVKQQRAAGLYEVDRTALIKRSERNPIVKELLANQLKDRSHELLHVHYSR